VPLRVGPPHRIPHHHGRAGAQPERSHVVEPQRVRRRDASLTTAPPAPVRVLVFPAEPDGGVASRERGAGPCRGGGRIGRGGRAGATLGGRGSGWRGFGGRARSRGGGPRDGSTARPARGGTAPGGTGSRLRGSG